MVVERVADYDHGTLKSRTIEGGKQTLEKWAVYLNDTITYKAFSATPGLRYDHTSTNGDFWSPSLGLTYQVHETTVLRGYIARGFSIPPLSATFGTLGTSDVQDIVRLSNPDLEVEKVNAYQVGVESTAIPYVWVKGTILRYDVSDAIETKEIPQEEESEATVVRLQAVNTGKARRQGFELELRTVPVYNISFTQVSHSSMRRTGTVVIAYPVLDATPPERTAALPSVKPPRSWTGT